MIVGLQFADVNECKQTDLELSVEILCANRGGVTIILSFRKPSCKRYQLRKGQSVVLSNKVELKCIKAQIVREDNLTSLKYLCLYWCVGGIVFICTFLRCSVGSYKEVAVFAFVL